MLQHSGVPECGFVVAKVGIKNTATLKFTQPRHRHVSTSFSVLLAQTIVPLERPHGLVLAQVKTDQDANLVRAHKRSRLILVNFVLVPKTLAIECTVENVLRIVEFERPRAAAVPRMTVELTTHHSRARLPFVKVVARGVDTSNSLALFHEVDHCLALRIVLESQMRGIVEQDRVVLREVFLGENRVLIGDVGRERSGLFSEFLDGIVPGRYRTVDKSFTSVKDQYTAIFFRLGQGLGRQRLLNLRLFVVAQRLDAIPIPSGFHHRSGEHTEGQQCKCRSFHWCKSDGQTLRQAEPDV